MLSIVDLLKLKGFDTSASVKMLRHQDQRYNVKEMIEKGHLETYQSFQKKPILDCDYAITFIGDEGNKAVFYNVYKVIDKKSAKDMEIPDGFPYPEFKQNDDYFYVLECVPGYEDYKDRVVIDWGKSALAWHQYLTDKEVLEILPRGYVKDFPGYLDFILSYQELKKLIDNPDANREWYRMLKGLSGVYLILDTNTGKQYVGSAYGSDGIWGRWSNYAGNGHGNNKQLMALLKDNPDYQNYFQYSILQVMPKSMGKDEIIQKECFFKDKLGSRAFGLNEN